MTKMLSEIKEQPEVLRNVFAKNETVLKNLAAEIKEKGVRHAVFAARGTSDHASTYAKYLLGIYCGMSSALAVPSAITLYGADFDFSHDLVVGVSQSGKAADALEVIGAGNKDGGITVAVTNDCASPMARSAKYHLDCSAGPEISVAATKTFTSEMMLLGLLTAHLSDNKQLLKDLNSVHTAVSEVIDTAFSEIEKLAARYTFIEDGFVLGRGIIYPVALEAALKIQETCYVKMKGYPNSDFYHGPIAQVDNGTFVILLAPKGKAFEDSVAMAKKIAETGAELLVFTNDKELAKEYRSVLLPDVSEAVAPFVFAPAIQYFAQCLSLSKGLDPDAPRMLKKVTITK
ncbi:MAG: SIS domain-containing protein [Clostridia bacterium]|nr:SIS domain-containing protein [Clostridia bacterium]